MARRNRKDAVTVSFHYLTRVAEDDDGEPKIERIGADEFKSAMEHIGSIPPIDTTAQEGVDKLRFSSTVPILSIQEVEPNLWFGSYQGVYTGHTYQNTAKGEIPYNSASLRTFYFLAYWSKPKGRVYIATQYLGQFGDYTGLKTTITRAFKEKSGIESHSFRNVSTIFQKFKAKEISIEYMSAGENAGAANSFGKTSTIVFKRSGDGNDFAEATRKRLFSVFTGPKDKTKAEVAKILRDNKLTAVSDDDILDCTVLAEVDGSEIRYYFINDNNYAMKFPTTVGMNAHGHPDPAQLQTLMRSMLKNQVLAKSENV